MVSMQDESPFPEPLMQAVREGYRLCWDGFHGWPHWLRGRGKPAPTHLL